MPVLARLRPVLHSGAWAQLIHVSTEAAINCNSKHILAVNACMFHTQVAKQLIVKKDTESIRGLNTNALENQDPESGMPLYHPKKGVLVYTGGMARNVKGLKMLSLSTSLLALLAQPFVLSAAKEDLIFKAGLMGSISAVVFFTPALVHFVTKKYVTDVYFNEDTKVFTLAYKSFFLRRKELQYIATDVEIPFVPRMFTTHLVKNRAFFMVAQDFRDKEIYRHMIGYDKPIDFGITKKAATDTPVKKKKQFGLFEDEDEKEKLQETKKEEPFIFSQRLMYDDDDDDDHHQVTKQKQNSKAR